VIQVTFIVLGLASMSNVINGLVNCSEAGKLFRKLTARCGRRGSVEVTDETKEGGETELK